MFRKQMLDVNSLLIDVFHFYILGMYLFQICLLVLDILFLMVFLYPS